MTVNCVNYPLSEFSYEIVFLNRDTFLYCKRDFHFNCPILDRLPYFSRQQPNDEGTFLRNKLRCLPIEVMKCSLATHRRFQCRALFSTDSIFGLGQKYFFMSSRIETLCCLIIRQTNQTWHSNKQTVSFFNSLYEIRRLKDEWAARHRWTVLLNDYWHWLINFSESPRGQARINFA